MIYDLRLRVRAGPFDFGLSCLLVFKQILRRNASPRRLGAGRMTSNGMIQDDTGDALE
jgi:hypothetical protein